MVFSTQELPEAQTTSKVLVVSDINKKFGDDDNFTNETLSEITAKKDQPSNSASITKPTENRSNLEFSNEEVNADMQLTNDSCMNIFGRVTEFTIHYEDMMNILKNFKNVEIPNPKIFLAEISEVMTKIHEESGILLDSLKKEQIKFFKSETLTLGINNVKLVEHDPGKRNKITNSNERNYLISLGPFRPKLNFYPINEEIPKDKQCRFTPLWYELYPMLEYSIEKDAAFCYVCSLFPEGPGRSNSISVWATEGARQWHKMKSCGRTKKGKLAEHFNSDAHKAALSDYCNFISEGGRIDILLNKNLRQDLLRQNQEKEFHRRVLLILLDIARTLSRQGLAFRGAGEDDNGNFKQVVNLISRHSPILKKWLDDTSSRSHHVTYLSSSSQNEFIKLLGDKVHEEIVNEIQIAGMYSVIADTTPDKKHHDRLTINVRYVTIDNNRLKPVERLLKIDSMNEAKTGEALAKKIFKTLRENQLSEPVFQSYDFAANMSGEFNGAQQKLSELFLRCIPYVPCQPHRVNIFVEDACNASTIFCEFFNTLQALYVFFSRGTKRILILEKELKEIENSLGLKDLSKTRWTARAETVRAVDISCEKIIITLSKIQNSKEIDSTKKTQSQAMGLYKKMTEFDFICCLYFAKNIMYKFKNLTEQLEKVEINVVDALQSLESVIKSLKLIDGEQINALVESAVLFAKKMKINAEEDFSKHHRTRFVPKKLDGKPETTAEFNLLTFYRKEFISVLDSFTNATTDNLKSMLKIFQPCQRLFQIPANRNHCSSELVKELLAMHPLIQNLDPDTVQTELEILLDASQECKDFDGICQTALRLKRALPVAFKIVCLILTSPISSASAERTFSKLKLIYSDLRTNSKDDRVDDLLILSSEKDLTDAIDLVEIMKKWSLIKERRIILS